jgi:hypothetical protein
MSQAHAQRAVCICRPHLLSCEVEMAIEDSGTSYCLGAAV